MQSISFYDSLIGMMSIAADEEGIVGIWFKGQKYEQSTLDEQYKKQDTPIIDQAKKWLDQYFEGKNPDFTPPLHLIGTSFQITIWQELMKIPYGKTTTYKDIAQIVAKQAGLTAMSAQAVGGAVGHNPISIIVPCHRVLGSNGSLTGYAGGLDRKRYLLELEGALHL